MDELVKQLHQRIALTTAGSPLQDDLQKAADAIEELTAKVESLQFFADNISKLPDCNTCLKKNICEFTPKYGEYCRINCPVWLVPPPKEE